MSLRFNTGAMQYRESPSDNWQPLVIQANMNWASMADIYDPVNGSYEYGEYVLYGGAMYRCISTTGASGTWDSTKWDAVTVGEEIENIKGTIDDLESDLLSNFAANYNASTSYTIGKYCIHDGKLYRCVVAIPSPGEAWNSSHWATTNISNQVYNTIIKISNQYNPARTYKKDEVCIYGDALKYCKIDMTQPEEWNFSHWGTVTGVMDVVGSGQLDSSFEADNLTGAANELKNTLTQLDSAKAAKVDLTDISQTSPTCTVQNGIPAGTYFYLDGVLAQAKTLINENAAFTEGTNYDEVTAGGLNSLNDNLTASSVTVTPNSTYISSAQISCVKNNYIASLSGWFNVNASIPSNGATILSNLPIIPINLYGINMKVLLVNQTTGGVYHCLVDGNGNLKTDYNRQNIPSGEYRIISCMYLLK